MRCRKKALIIYGRISVAWRTIGRVHWWGVRENRRPTAAAVAVVLNARKHIFGHLWRGSDERGYRGHGRCCDGDGSRLWGLIFTATWCRWRFLARRYGGFSVRTGALLKLLKTRLKLFAWKFPSYVSFLFFAFFLWFWFCLFDSFSNFWVWPTVISLSNPVLYPSALGKIRDLCPVLVWMCGRAEGAACARVLSGRGALLLLWNGYGARRCLHAWWCCCVCIMRWEHGRKSEKARGGTKGFQFGGSWSARVDSSLFLLSLKIVCWFKII